PVGRPAGRITGPGARRGADGLRRDRDAAVADRGSATRTAVLDRTAVVGVDGARLARGGSGGAARAPDAGPYGLPGERSAAGRRCGHPEAAAAPVQGLSGTGDGAERRRAAVEGPPRPASLSWLRRCAGKLCEAEQQAGSVVGQLPGAAVLLPGHRRGRRATAPRAGDGGLAGGRIAVHGDIGDRVAEPAVVLQGGVELLQLTAPVLAVDDEVHLLVHGDVRICDLFEDGL